MNTPTKSTVYLPVKEGESEISVSYWEKDTHITDVKEQQVFVFTPEQLNEYTANVIKEALKTAAKKVSLKNVFAKGFVNNMKTIVYKKSITNTFEETFKRFKI